MPADSYQFDLSHDELAWLLYTLRMPPLLGMEASLFPSDTPENVGNARLQSGGMALIARGYVQVNGGNTLQLDNLLTGTLGAAAFAQKAALLISANSSDNTTRAYYVSPDLLLEHRLPVINIHRFTIANQLEEVIGRMMQHLNVDARQPISYIQMNSDMLTEVVERIQNGDQQGATHLLLQNGWEDISQTQFITSLQKNTTRRNALIFLGAHTENGARSLQVLAALVIYAGPDGLFCLDLTQQATHEIHVQPYSENELRQGLANILAL